MKITIQIVDGTGNVYAGEAVLEHVSGDRRGVNRVKSKPRNPSSKVSCPSAINGLWKKEKFKQVRSFVDVKAALAEDGYNFPRNTVMMALQSAAFLTRHGGRGSYVWTQKYPFTN
jgi:hypothetical protein